MKKIIIISFLAAFASGCAVYIPRPAPVVEYEYTAPSYTVYRSAPKYIHRGYYRDRVVIKKHYPRRVKKVIRTRTHWYYR